MRFALFFLFVFSLFVLVESVDGKHSLKIRRSTVGDSSFSSSSSSSSSSLSLSLTESHDDINGFFSYLQYQPSERETLAATEKWRQERSILEEKIQAETKEKLSAMTVDNAKQIKDEENALKSVEALSRRVDQEMHAQEQAKILSAGMPFVQKENRERVMGNKFCWKDSYTRGVGQLPGCDSDRYKENSLCYKYCNSGYSANAFLCWENCRSGYSTYPMTCTDWGDSYGKGCCCTIWGCCGCRSGYRDEGCTCRRDSKTYSRKSYDRGVGIVPMTCGSDTENSAGLCYPKCRTEYSGESFVCWRKCSGELPVDCGMGCAASMNDCVQTIIDQVLGPIEIVANIVTLGGTSGIKAGIKTALKGISKAIASVVSKGVSKEAVKAAIRNAAKEAGQFLAETTITTLAEKSMRRQMTDWELEDLAALDPTGISGLVLAYAHGTCS